MRSHLIVLVAFAAVATLGPLGAVADAKEISAALVQPVVDMAATLASDKMDGVTEKAAAVDAEAARLGAPASRIAAAATQLEKTRKIDDARVAFGALNEAIVEYMQAQKLTPSTGVRVAFCPMVEKPWLQKDGPIRNPYYGYAMLTCGSFK